VIEKKLLIISDNMYGGVSHHTNQIIKYVKKYKNFKIFLCQEKKDVDKINKINFKKNDVVILQYSPHGFQKKGVCFWILNLIKKLKKKIKIIIFFHDCYSYSFLPWKSAFWLYFLQKFIFLQLCKSFDIGITPSIDYFNLIKKFSNKKIIYFPTTSSFHESKKKINKQRILTIFGTLSLRKKIYEKLGLRLINWAQKNNYKIIDIGPTMEKNIIKKFSKHGVIFKGILNSKNVNKILEISSFGLLDYDIKKIDKSSVLAAYSASKVVPIIFNEEKNKILRKNFHYLTNLPDNKINIEKLSNNIYKWYKAHGQNEFHKKIILKFVIKNF